MWMGTWWLESLWKHAFVPLIKWLFHVEGLRSFFLFNIICQLYDPTEITNYLYSVGLSAFLCTKHSRNLVYKGIMKSMEDLVPT